MLVLSSKLGCLLFRYSDTFNIFCLHFSKTKVMHLDINTSPKSYFFKNPCIPIHGWANFFWFLQCTAVAFFSQNPKIKTQSRDPKSQNPKLKLENKNQNSNIKSKTQILVLSSNLGR
jgi:hypothetical protein